MVSTGRSLALLGAALAVGALGPPSPARAATQVLHVGDTLARFSMLTPGVRRYLRYKIENGHRNVLDIWTREVRFEPADGPGRFRITQQWDHAAPNAYVLRQDALFEAGTFRPLTYVRRLTRGGETKVAGYRFFADRIVGMADLEGNVKKDFTAASPEPAYNFENDMELLQTLPLGPGYSVNLNFYDAGLEPPARYTFAVVGSERLAGPDGRPIDCWLVTSNYNDPKAVPTRFWFAKRDQVLIREEGHLPDGAILVKTLLNPEAEDRGA